ncbi:MAG: DUF166 domain-containing protein [Candidatus Hydrothermarchaeota archaeon]
MDKLKILLILRGKYGERVEETINKYGRNVSVVKKFSLPKEVPSFIEHPEEYFPEDFPDYFKDVDMVFTYSLHPDLTSYIVDIGSKQGVKTFLIPKEDESALYLKNKRKDLSIIVPLTCCSLVPKGIKEYDRFAKEFGFPKYKIKLEDDTIKEITVIKGSPCGASWFVAENLVGKDVSQAPRLAGLYTQYYPCRSKRGMDIVKGESPIHLAGKFHMNAIEKAIKEAIEKNDN